MVYTVTQAISSAFYTAGVVGKEFEQVDGDQFNDGLVLLNSLLAKKTADKSGIPYFLQYNDNFIIGQEQYYIPGLISIETMTFFIDNPPGPIIVNPTPAPPTPGPIGAGNQVRYSMIKVNRKQYWETPRANQILSLPYQFYYDRQFGGASVYVYFLPNAAYQFQIWGLFALNDVTLNQDLSTILDQFYIDFLKFELAERICAEYDYSMPEGAAHQLDEYRNIIDKREQRMDLTLQHVSPLTRLGDGLNYAWANLGTGWRVP